MKGEPFPINKADNNEQSNPFWVEMMSLASKIIFGGAPTQEEAKEATSALKEALDRMYFPSTNEIGWLKSSPLEGYADSKAWSTAESGVASSPLQTLVWRAFSLLTGSPEAQNAVASLVSDENVWNAVIQNSKVMEFIRLRNPSSSSKVDYVVTEPHSDTTSDDDYKSCISDNEFNETDSENWIIKFINQIKITIAEILNGVTGLFDIIFKDVSRGFIMNGDGKTSGGNVADRTTGATFMALGVIAIFMVVVKRGETAVAVQFMNQKNIKYINFLLKTTPTI